MTKVPSCGSAIQIEEYLFCVLGEYIYMRTYMGTFTLQASQPPISSSRQSTGDLGEMDGTNNFGAVLYSVGGVIRTGRQNLQKPLDLPAFFVSEA